MLEEGKLLVLVGSVSVREWEERREYSVLCDKMLAFTEEDVDQVALMLKKDMWLEQVGVAEEETLDASGLSIIMPERPTHEMISQLRTIFQGAPGHEPVYLLVESGEKQRRVSTEYAVEKTRSVLEQIQGIVGEGNVF